MPDIQDRVLALKQNAERKVGFVEDESWYMFRVAPTCPPSRRLHMRGGRLVSTYLYGSPVDEWEKRTWTVPNLTVDLADVTSASVDISFENPDYYQFFLLELRMPLEPELPTASDWMFYLHGTWDEFATAGEAEAWMSSLTFQQSHPLDHYYYRSRADGDFYGFALCGLVLKNNGEPGGGCPILPVDLVNRGRSYMWPVDLRAITSIYD